MGVFEIIGMVTGVIDRIFPNKSEAQRLALTLELAKLEGELKIAEKQAEVNAIDAASEDKFQSRWRPTAAWMCVGALAIGFICKIVIPVLLILLPLFGFSDTIKLQQILTQLSALDIEMFQTMLFGLLGLGAYRSYEKVAKRVK